MARKWADKGSRHERGYGAEWQKLREQTLRRDQHLCQPCKRNGRLTPAREVDHITPKARGGKDELSNTQAICKPCHQAKTLQEAAEARGATYQPRQAIGIDGWPEL